MREEFLPAIMGRFAKKRAVEQAEANAELDLLIQPVLITDSEDHLRERINLHMKSRGMTPVQGAALIVSAMSKIDVGDKTPDAIAAARKTLAAMDAVVEGMVGSVFNNERQTLDDAMRNRARFADSEQIDAALELVLEKIGPEAMEELEKQSHRIPPWMVLREGRRIATDSQNNYHERQVKAATDGTIKREELLARWNAATKKAPDELGYLSPSRERVLTSIVNQRVEGERLQNSRAYVDMHERAIFRGVTEERASELVSKWAKAVDDKIITVQQLKNLQGMLGAKRSRDVSDMRVLSRAFGGKEALTSNDDAAITRMAQEAGLVGEDGSITNADEYGFFIVGMGRFPSQTIKSLYAGAGSSDPDTVKAAIHTIQRLQAIAPGPWSNATPSSSSDRSTAGIRISYVLGLFDYQGAEPYRMNARTKQREDNPLYLPLLDKYIKDSMLFDKSLFDNMTDSDLTANLTGESEGAAQSEKMLADLHDGLLEWQKERIRWLIVPNVEIVTTDVPTAYVAKFERRASDLYHIFTNGTSMSNDSAKELALKQAANDMRSEWIMFVLHDKLNFVNRRNLPKDLDFGPTAGQQWEDNFKELIEGGKISPDEVFEDYVPATIPSENRGVVFHKADGGIGSVLTYLDGKPVVFATQTLQELADDFDAGRKTESTAKAKAARTLEIDKKMEFMTWLVLERRRRDESEGKPYGYDRRIDAYDKTVDDSHVRWYIGRVMDAKKEAPAGFFGRSPFPPEESALAKERDRIGKGPSKEPAIGEVNRLPPLR